MSETPRCDAFGDEPYKGDNARLVLLWIRFAESLERDLTQAKAELAAVTAERDALREELNAVLSDWNDVVRASGSKSGVSANSAPVPPS